MGQKLVCYNIWREKFITFTKAAWMSGQNNNQTCAPRLELDIVSSKRQIDCGFDVDVRAKTVCGKIRAKRCIQVVLDASDYKAVVDVSKMQSNVLTSPFSLEDYLYFLLMKTE